MTEEVVKQIIVRKGTDVGLKELMKLEMAGESRNRIHKMTRKEAREMARRLGR